MRCLPPIIIQLGAEQREVGEEMGGGGEGREREVRCKVKPRQREA